MKKAVAIILAVFLLCSCGTKKNTDKGENEAAEGNILYITGYNFESANPLDVKNNLNRNIFSLIYSSLYKTDENGFPEAVLAESSVCSSDNLSWEITLKNNISFHNGEPLSAKDVVYTVNYLLTNDTVYSSNVRNIASARAVSAYTAVITLSEPAINFPAQLTFPVIPAGGFGKTGFNGTGTYKVIEYIEKKKLMLSAIESIPMGKNGIKKIEVQLVADKETAVYANQSGMSDVFLSEELLETSTELSKSGVNSREFINNRFGFLLLNHDKPYFSDVNVRKAIDLSINRKDIVENILFLKAVPAATPIKPGYYLMDRIKENGSDIEAARKLLTDNGYINNVSTGVFEKEMTYIYVPRKILPEENEEEITAEETEEISEPEPITEIVPLSFEITVNSENAFRIQIANNICEQLRPAGIEAKVKILSFEEYEKAFATGDYDAVLGTMILSEDNDLSEFARKDGITKYKSDEGDAIINNLKITSLEDKKREAYKSLESFFETQVPLISLYFEKGGLHYAKRVSGEFSPSSNFIFDNIENWQLASK